MSMRFVGLAGGLAGGALVVLAAAAASAGEARGADWPSYNRTLTSDRFAPLTEINRDNVARLRPVCTYDVGRPSAFQAGPLVVGRTLYTTSENDTLAIDADTCALKWRVSEPVTAGPTRVNRGAAYLDGRLFRGVGDGRVVAYDALTGAKQWETRIADPARGEGVPAAPVAWNGLVFIGNSGGDVYGVKGRIYALDAATGRQVWETYLVPNGAPPPSKNFPDIAATWGNAPNVPIAGGATWTSYTVDPASGMLWVPAGNPAPDLVRGVRPGDNLFTNSAVGLDARTGAYRAHFSITPGDYHDWDVSGAPVVLRSRAGKRLLAIAPKDGRIYGYDLGNNRRLFATPVTTLENTEAPLSAVPTRFCPGTLGGSEWNGPGYNPTTNLLYVGSVDWCTTTTALSVEAAGEGKVGQRWFGNGSQASPGQQDPKDKWKGWVTAVDADSGVIRWRFQAPAPVLAGVTPTAGGLVFAADMTGAAYAFDADDGKVLWRTMLDAPAGGGLISYAVDGKQRVALVSGVNSAIWMEDKRNAKITIFGLR